jgi:hypothetical protein
MSNLVADSYHRASMSLGMLSTAAIFVNYRLIREIEGKRKSWAEMVKGRTEQSREYIYLHARAYVVHDTWTGTMP